ncbi:aminotransferase [Paraphysoderma sedebokerense]|nr:aminotransferase [Paraphysoderma sedebokerense]
MSSFNTLLPRLGLRRNSPFVKSLRHLSSSTEPAKLSELSSSALRVSRTTNPKPLVPVKDLVFGRTFTDHMFSVEWTATKGWGTPKIHPYDKICLEPSSTVFHYGQECFEGMKAYKDAKGKIRLFRPDMNLKRINKSAARLALPTFSSKDFLACLSELLKVDSRWIPQEKGYSLYIRPTLIATQESLGVGPSSKALLFVICSPVGPYYKTGFAAVNLLAETKYVRAFPGGTGDAKIGGNYAPTILPQIHASNLGYQQILWLYGQNHELTEVGTMNCFVFWTNENGEKELVTPPLDGTILPGVTRDSILALTKGWNEFKVSERKVLMKDIVKAEKEKRLHEMFGAGTACIVSPIKKISYNNATINVPLDPSNPNSQAGPLAKRLNEMIMGIQYGEINEGRGWSVVVD